MKFYESMSKKKEFYAIFFLTWHVNVYWSRIWQNFNQHVKLCTFLSYIICITVKTYSCSAICMRIYFIHQFFYPHFSPHLTPRKICSLWRTRKDPLMYNFLKYSSMWIFFNVNILLCENLHVFAILLNQFHWCSIFSG